MFGERMACGKCVLMIWGQRGTAEKPALTISIRSASFYEDPDLVNLFGSREVPL